MVSSTESLYVPLPTKGTFQSTAQGEDFCFGVFSDSNPSSAIYSLRDHRHVPFLSVSQVPTYKRSNYLIGLS